MKGDSACEVKAGDFGFDVWALGALAEDLEMSVVRQQIERLQKVGDAFDRVEAADEANIFRSMGGSPMI